MADLSPDAPRLLTRTDPGWPRRLDDAKPAVERLRLIGELHGSHRPWIAIVGTRRADDDGLDFARRLAFDLARAGAVIVSGGARGIDGAAHEGSLDANGLTVAVLATGFDPVYPPTHALLFARIARSRGTLITETEDGTPPTAPRFLARNRIIAALCTAVVVVQAPVRSGALSTARAARDLGRNVWAVPSAPWDPRGVGSNELLAAGAKICTSWKDVLSVAACRAGTSNGPAVAARAKRRDCYDLDPDEARLWACLGPRPRHADELACRTELPPARVQRAILGLLLHGLASERSAGWYVRARDRA